MSKFDHFEKYARRQAMARFMARYERFKLQMHIKGCIVEYGVHHGDGLMAWAKVALQTFLPRMNRGSILAFDEINNRWCRARRRRRDWTCASTRSGASRSIPTSHTSYSEVATS